MSKPHQPATNPTTDPATPDAAEHATLITPEMVAPWGCAPTPLLPVWHLQACASLKAAPELAAHNPDVSTVADMSRFWDKADCAQLDGAELRAVAASVAPYVPPPSLLVIPDGTPRDQLMRLPLRPRTLRRVSMLPKICGPTTVADMLGPPGFAAGTLIDAMCVIEAALAPSAFGPLSEAVAAFYTPAATAAPHTAAAARAAVRVADWVSTLTGEPLEALRTHILPERPPQPRRRPHTPPDPHHATAQRLKEQLHTIASHDIAAAATEITNRLGRVCTATEAAAAFEAVLPAPAPDASEPVTAAADLTRRMITARSGYTINNEHNLALAPDATRTARQIAARATEAADDVGLVDEQAIHNTIWLPPELATHFEQLATAAGLTRLSGHLSRRDTTTAAVKAALKTAGQPQTRNQLAQTLNLEPKLVGNRLSRIQSIARSDKRHWALTEWIAHPYDSLAHQMRQAITKAGGATNLEQLAQQMNQQWGVSPASVHSLASTPAFNRSDNQISIAKLPQPPKPPSTPTQQTCTAKITQRHLDGFSLASIPPNLVALLGCGPGVSTTAKVNTPPNTRDLSIIWRPTSVSGPEIGRASDALAALGTQPGDTIRITAHNNGTIDLELAQTTPQPII